MKTKFGEDEVRNLAFLQPENEIVCSHRLLFLVYVFLDLGQNGENNKKLFSVLHAKLVFENKCLPKCVLQNFKPNKFLEFRKIKN